MALVAYADSDIEDSEDDDMQDIPSSAEKDNTNINIDNEIKLFSSLPLPKKKTKNNVCEDDDMFLHKKEKSSVDQVKPQRNIVKITIPSLSKIPDSKPMLSTAVTVENKNKTRLLSMLPEPKFSKSLSDKAANNTFKFIPRTVNASKPVISKPLENKKPVAKAFVNVDSDESDTEEGNVSEKNLSDFFSLNAENNETMHHIKDDDIVSNHLINVPKDINAYINENPYKDNESLPQVPLPERANEYNEAYSIQGESSSSNTNETIQLDEEAIIKLCGRKARHKRGDVQIIDINQKEILPDSREWLLKAMTEDNSKRVSSKRRGDEPTNVQKRKHQITYLAHQAKANELDLQNQWANNRMSRKQTQSKYGF